MLFFFFLPFCLDFPLRPAKQVSEASSVFRFFFCPGAAFGFAAVIALLLLLLQLSPARDLRASLAPLASGAEAAMGEGGAETTGHSSPIFEIASSKPSSSSLCLPTSTVSLSAPASFLFSLELSICFFFFFSFFCRRGRSDGFKSVFVTERMRSGLFHRVGD